MIVEPSSGLVSVERHDIHYRSFGRPDKGTVLGLAGGPLGTHGHMLPMADLVQFGYRVVLYDYLGCGESDRPKAHKYYTQSSAVDEVEAIRRALRLGKVHLLGVSYGGALALDVALKYPKSLRSLVISSGFPSEALHEEWNPHTPSWVRETITSCAERGDFSNPGYVAAREAMNRAQVCRLRVWPYDLWESLTRGASDYFRDTLPDRLEGWDVTSRLSEIRLPCLIIAGKFDVESPKSARAIHRGVRGSKLVIFGDCSHTPFWEDRVRFIEMVRDFLDGASQSPRKRP
jgi:proline-specific peptidase